MDDDRRGRVVRVSGPDSQEWSFQDEWRPRRSGVPIFGLFLILLGLFLILNTYVPVAQVGGDVFFIVIGLLLLGNWARDRGHASLYLGAIITSLSLAGLVTDLDLVRGDAGWGTFFLGIAFLVIAAIRAAGRAGLGWQVVVGVVLTIAGGSQVASYYGSPDINRFAVPLLIILFGIWVVTRERGVHPR